MRVGLLGPLLVYGGEGGLIELAAGKQRAVLACAALRANQPVSVGALADALWGEAQPPNARVAVLNYVARLRRNLGVDSARLRTVPGGYQLTVDEDELDHVRADRLRERARRAADGGGWPAVEEAAGEALGLWRGEPFADFPLVGLEAEFRPGFAELRLGLEELRVDALLHTGRGEQALSRLTELIALEPLRETLFERMLLALYGSRRRTEALDYYIRARTMLREELGVEPSPMLTSLQELVLRDAPYAELLAAWRGRREAEGEREAGGNAVGNLPPEPRLLVGRERELDLLGRLLASDARVLALAGPAGVGKTTLALAWAHRHAADFPDGCLYLDLHGFAAEEEPLTPDEAVRELLGLLGLEPGDVPRTPEARAARYRRSVEGRAALFVFDNAHDAAQVRPLLPPGDAGRTVVTSRGMLTGLVVRDGADSLALDPLDAAAAGELLARRLGPERVSGQEDALAEIAAYCAHLPLALAVAAARAAALPNVPLAALARQLATGTLDALHTADAASSVRNVLSWSYRRLSDPAARLLRFLGLHPGPDISAAAAAALADLIPAEASVLLTELAAVSLIAETSPARYAAHSLLQAFAAELAENEIPAGQRRAALLRLYDYHLRWAVAADHVYVTLPTELEADGVALPAGLETPSFADAAAALDWMAAEQHVLMALVRHACAHGFDSHAWRLAHAQSCSLMLRRRWHDDIRQAGLALSAAARTGDPLAAAHVERQLGRAHVFAGELEAGMYRLRRALECYQASGDLIGLAETHRALGTLHYLRDDFEQAEAHYRIQLGYARELGHRKSISVALTHRSGCLTKLGRYAQALPLAAESLAVAESIGDERYVYSAWDELGQVHRGLGNAEASLFCFRRGLELCADTDNRLVGSSLLEARIAAAEGDLTRARELCLEVWHAQKDDDPEMAKQAEQMLAELEI